MAAWQQTPTGYYPGQPGPPPPGFYPPGSDGYPKPDYPQQPGYPPQPNYNQGQGFPPPPYGGGGFVPPVVPPVFGHFPTGPDPAMNSYQEDPVGSGSGNFQFSEKSIRMAFIRKVYMILMLQLGVTLSIGTLFVFHEGTKQYVRTHPGLWFVAIITAFVTLIVISCCGDVRRKAPMNFVLLLVFTLAQSFLVGVTVSLHKMDSVIYAVGICTVVCLALTVFAFQTKIDFTVMGGFLFVAVIILLVFGILLMFFPSKIATLVYASIGALIFSLYIVYDTQMMIGGDHKYSISPEEYIFAALNLYIDIINLFMYILTILSASKD